MDDRFAYELVVRSRDEHREPQAMAAASGQLVVRVQGHDQICLDLTARNTPDAVRIATQIGTVIGEKRFQPLSHLLLKIMAVLSLELLTPKARRSRHITGVTQVVVTATPLGQDIHAASRW